MPKKAEKEWKKKKRKKIHYRVTVIKSIWNISIRIDTSNYTWSPDAKSWLTGKELDAEKVWRQRGNGATKDEMAGWDHRLNGHEFEQTQGDSKG